MEGELRHLAGREHHQLMVAGAGARDALVLQIEDETLQRDEHAAGVLLRQFVIQPAQNLVRLGDLPGQRAQDRDGDRHEQRRGDAFPDTSPSATTTRSSAARSTS